MIYLSLNLANSSKVLPDDLSGESVVLVAKNEKDAISIALCREFQRLKIKYDFIMESDFSSRDFMLGYILASTKNSVFYTNEAVLLNKKKIESMDHVMEFKKLVAKKTAKPAEVKKRGRKAKPDMNPPEEPVMNVVDNNKLSSLLDSLSLTRAIKKAEKDKDWVYARIAEAVENCDEEISYEMQLKIRLLDTALSSSIYAKTKDSFKELKKLSGV